MKLLLYCCKNNKKMLIKKDQVVFGERKIEYIYDRFLLDNEQALNGKIVAECDYEVEELFMGYGCGETFAKTKTMQLEEILKRSCLSEDELCEYMPNYAIHSKNLHIFDEPKELNEVYSIKDIGGGLLVTEPLKKAPQNMMRVSINKWDYGCANFDDIHIVISIRPEWMCLILNRIKDVEVRRVVLKEMLK